MEVSYYLVHCRQMIPRQASYRTSSLIHLWLSIFGTQLLRISSKSSRHKKKSSTAKKIQNIMKFNQLRFSSCKIMHKVYISQTNCCWSALKSPTSNSADRGLTQSPEAKAKGGSGLQTKSTKRITFDAEQPSAIRLPWLKFSVIFLSCKANGRGFDAQSGHGPDPLPQARWHHLSALQTSHNSSMRQSQPGLRTQTANQPELIPPIISTGQPRP